MARSEARLHFDVWNGLEGKGPDARLLYVVLLSDRSVNHAGVGSIRMDQWQRHSALPADRVEAALVELAVDQQVVIDRVTGEFLIRTLIRNDKYTSQPYLLKGALAVATLTESQTLRSVLAAELRLLPPRRPDGLGKGDRVIVYPDPHAVADQLDPQGPDRPSRKGLDTQSGNRSDGYEPTPFREGVEREGGGGGGGGSSSCSVGVKLGGRASAHASPPPTEPSGQAELGLITAVPPLPAVAPLCPRHSKMPAGVEPPPCRACKNSRLTWEHAIAQVDDDAATLRQLRRAAIDACGRCDPETGTVTTTSGAVARCPCNAPQPLHAVTTRAG